MVQFPPSSPPPSSPPSLNSFEKEKNALLPAFELKPACNSNLLRKSSALPAFINSDNAYASVAVAGTDINASLNNNNNNNSNNSNNNMGINRNILHSTMHTLTTRNPFSPEPSSPCSSDYNDINTNNTNNNNYNGKKDSLNIPRVIEHDLLTPEPSSSLGRSSSPTTFSDSNMLRSPLNPKQYHLKRVSSNISVKTMVMEPSEAETTAALDAFKRIPLATLKRVHVPYNGEIVKVGRSSKSCAVSISRTNKLISRVHAHVSYNQENNALQITCIGWNGITVIARGGKSFLQKDETILHRQLNGIIFDICGDRAIVDTEIPSHLLQDNLLHSDFKNNFNNNNNNKDSFKSLLDDDDTDEELPINICLNSNGKRIRSDGLLGHDFKVWHDDDKSDSKAKNNTKNNTNNNINNNNNISQTDSKLPQISKVSNNDIKEKTSLVANETTKHKSHDNQVQSSQPQNRSLDSVDNHNSKKEKHYNNKENVKLFENEEKTIHTTVSKIVTNKSIHNSNFFKQLQPQSKLLGPPLKKKKVNTEIEIKNEIENANENKKEIKNIIKPLSKKDISNHEGITKNPNQTIKEKPSVVKPKSVLSEKTNKADSLIAKTVPDKEKVAKNNINKSIVLTDLNNSNKVQIKRKISPSKDEGKKIDENDKQKKKQKVSVDDSKLKLAKENSSSITKNESVTPIPTTNIDSVKQSIVPVKTESGIKKDSADKSIKKAIESNEGFTKDVEITDKLALENFVSNHLAYSRIASIPLSDIHSALINSSSLNKISKQQLTTILEQIKWVGEIKREGKDAAGAPLESEFYYTPDFDEDQNRKQLVENMRGHHPLRSCRKTHKQYFWKKPAKK